MAAAYCNKRRIVVHVSGGALYENGGRYPLSSWNDEHHKKISASVVEFLSDNGYDAVSETPPPYGAAAAGVDVVISTGKLFLTFKKINDLVQRLRDEDALSKRRSLFPSFILRLEVQESRERTTYPPTDDDLNSARVLVALTKEISELLNKRYSACRFEYLLIAPKGKYACFSIYIPEKLITNVNLMKVIKSLSRRKAYTFCTIKLNKKWLLPPYVSFLRKSHDSSIGTLMTHHVECHLPEYELIH